MVAKCFMPSGFERDGVGKLRLCLAFATDQLLAGGGAIPVWFGSGSAAKPAGLNPEFLHLFGRHRLA